MINIQEDVTKHLQDILDFDLKRAMSDIGIDSIERINDRVEKGVDVDGKPFKEYSEFTKKSKKKTGRSTKVNLQQSGEMMNSLDFEVSNNVTTVKLPDRTHKKSNESISQIGDKNHAERSFLGHNKKEVSEIWKDNIIEPFEDLLK